MEFEEFDSIEFFCNPNALTWKPWCRAVGVVFVLLFLAGGILLGLWLGGVLPQFRFQSTEFCGPVEREHKLNAENRRATIGFRWLKEIVPATSTIDSSVSSTVHTSATSKISPTLKDMVLIFLIRLTFPSPVYLFLPFPGITPKSVLSLVVSVYQPIAHCYRFQIFMTGKHVSIALSVSNP